MAYHLEAGEQLVGGLARIAQEQLHDAGQDLRTAASGDESAVHEFRKRCKKLRGWLRLVRPALTEDRFHRADDALRDAGRALAAIRATTVQARAAAALGVSTASEEETAIHGVGVCDATATARNELGTAAIVLADWKPDAACVEEAMLAGFRRTYRRARKAWRKVQEQPSDDGFHELRKWIKYHWYQTRLLEHRGDAVRMHRRRKKLGQLGEILGEAHDLAVLEASSPPTRAERARGKKYTLLEQARPALAKILRPGPNKLIYQLLLAPRPNGPGREPDAV